MQNISKFTWLMLILACMSLAIVGCRGSAGSGTTAAANSITGTAAKGPFEIGSTVTAFQINPDGTRSATNITTTVTDNLGSYIFPNIPWSGMTEVESTGFYYDEDTGVRSTGSGSVSAMNNLPPLIAGAANTTTMNPNIASTIATSVAKQTLATTPTTNLANLDAVLQASNQQTAVALGLPTTIGGLAIDLSQLSVTNTANPTLGLANTQLLAISAGLLNTTNGGAGGTINALATSLAIDINAGNALGAASGTTAAIQAGQAAATTNAATIANNLNNLIVATVPNAVVDPSLVANLSTAATTVATTSSTTLRGFALAGNTFTMGPVTYNVAASGVSTAGAGVIPVNNVVFGLTFRDYSNTAGTGNGPVSTNLVTLTFKIADTVGSRVVNGSLFPVNIVTDGAGAVAVSVPQGATLNFSGIDSAGVAVTGTANNIAANTIQTNASIVSINMNNLLTIIQSKVGVQAAAFNVLQTAGTYTFEFGIGGLNVGIENATMNGLASLLPTSTVVAGRSISGVITTQ